MPEPFRQIIFSSPVKRNEHPQMSNGRFLANAEDKVWNVPQNKAADEEFVAGNTDGSVDVGVEGVDSVNVHPGTAPLVSSPIYVTIYSCVYRSGERFTYRG